MDALMNLTWLLRKAMCFLCEYSSEATKQPKLHLFIKISIFTSTLCFSFTIDFATDLDTMKHDIDTDTGYDTNMDIYNV